MILFTLNRGESFFFREEKHDERLPRLLQIYISSDIKFFLYEPKKKCIVLSAFRIQSIHPIYLKLLLTKLKNNSLFSVGIYLSLTLLSLITCDFYGDLMRVFGISKTYSFAGLPLP